MKGRRALCAFALAVLSASAQAAAPRRFVCPQAWIEDRMPRVLAPGERAVPARDYFVINGARRAIRPGERALARRRCGVSPQIVW